MGYGGKVVEQQRARELRAQAWTRQDIATELGVSKSSVSLWVRDVDFFVLGLALYAGEGTKRGGSVCFANSDPRMIWMFVTGCAGSSTWTRCDSG